MKENNPRESGAIAFLFRQMLDTYSIKNIIEYFRPQIHGWNRRLWNSFFTLIPPNYMKFGWIIQKTFSGGFRREDYELSNIITSSIFHKMKHYGT